MPPETFFDATREVRFYSIEPGKQATAKMEIIGHPQLSREQEEQLQRGGEMIVIGTLTFEGEYITVDGEQFPIEDEMKISLVEEREECDPGDRQCLEAVGCLIELSNSMSCTLEFADIVPYLDKPVAVVLATSDACEIKSKLESGDTIGAAISAILMASDVGDNIGEAVPVVGNAASMFADIVEGAADCIEGYVYDAVDTYCVGEDITSRKSRGYTGCAEEIFSVFAVETANWEQPKSARHSIVAVAGSPIILGVVDDDGDELGLDDGVLIIQKEELKIAFIKNPAELTNGYNFKIDGIDNGVYNLYLAMISDGQIVETIELEDQPINLDETKEIPLAVKSKGDKLTDLLIGQEVEDYKKSQRLKTIIIIVSAAVVIILLGLVIWKFNLLKFLKKQEEV